MNPKKANELANAHLDDAYKVRLALDQEVLSLKKEIGSVLDNAILEASNIYEVRNALFDAIHKMNTNEHSLLWIPISSNSRKVLRRLRCVCSFAHFAGRFTNKLYLPSP